VLFSEGQSGTANNDQNRIGKRIKKLISSEPTAGERSRRSEITAAHLLGP